MDVIRASIMKHRKKGDHYNKIIEKCMVAECSRRAVPVMQAPTS
jgi:hypothetical protein